MAEAQDDRQPWVKFYYADWRADGKLRICGLAARGLWMDILALMHEATPYGHLLINGSKPSVGELARVIGAKVKETEKALAELIVRGVPSLTADGVLYSRRMVRDRRRSRIASENGSLGGNPSLTKSDKPDAPKPDKPVLKATRARVPEARGQKPDLQPIEEHRAGKRGEIPDCGNLVEDTGTWRHLCALVGKELDAHPEFVAPDDPDCVEHMKDIAGRAGFDYRAVRMALDAVFVARLRKRAS